MLKAYVISGAVALALVLPATTRAQTNPQLDEIRKQIQDMKESYDTRIQALEKQLKDAEDTAAKAQSAATQAQSTAGQAKESAEAASQATGLKPPASPSAFNPAMSLILQGGYYNSNQNPATRTVTGFLGPGELGLPPRGFDVGETEITLSANVDHLFYGQATLSIQDGVTDVEEAFFQTIGLGHGLTITGARYFSGVGYWNSFHKHAWDFEDAPSCSRRSWARTSRSTACVQAGSHRCRCMSSSASKGASPSSSRSPTATTTATAFRPGPCSRMWAMTSASAAAIALGSGRCGPRIRSLTRRSPLSTSPG